MQEVLFILAVIVIIYIFRKRAKNKERLKELEITRLEQERLLLEYEDQRKKEQAMQALEEERAALQKKVNYYSFIFQQCGLTSNDKNKIPPIYQAEQETPGGEKALYFSSLVPLSEWLAKKELLEEYLELKIITIEQGKKPTVDADGNRMVTKKIRLTVTNKKITDMINWDDEYINQKGDILNIGMSYTGVIGMNLEIYPHTFIAGTSGSGKTNLLKCLIHQALAKNYDVVLIDFKRGISFTEFEDRVKIYFDYETTRNALKSLVAETNQRLDTFREHKVDNLKKYNQLPNQRKYRRKIIFIDELAELMTVSDKKLAHDFYDCIETLTRISRAAGINLIMATQRVDSTIISGQIKSNVIARICGSLPDIESSRIMLGNNMACQISPEQQGRVMVKTDTFQEVQCFYYETAKRPLSGKTINHHFEEPEAGDLNDWDDYPPDDFPDDDEPKKGPTPDFDFSDF